MQVSERLQERSPVFREFPLPPGEGAAKRRVRARMPKYWAFLPSSGASRHLLPEGEGLARSFFRNLDTCALGESGATDARSASPAGRSLNKSLARRVRVTVSRKFLPY